VNAVVKPSLTITYQREAAVDLWPELTPLLEKHYHEIAHYPDIPLCPDHLFYEQAEAAGLLRTYTARVDGRLVGYANFFFRPNPKYSGSRQAVADNVFLDPDYRHGRLGMGMLIFAHESLEAEGAEVIMHHVKIAHPALGRLLEHLGYEPVDIIYARRVPHGR
jgi:GNAT superfamily N-acetyltransferase